MNLVRRFVIEVFVLSIRIREPRFVVSSCTVPTPLETIDTHRMLAIGLHYGRSNFHADRALFGVFFQVKLLPEHHIAIPTCPMATLEVPHRSNVPAYHEVRALDGLAVAITWYVGIPDVSGASRLGGLHKARSVARTRDRHCR